jgi:transcriptional regulator with XRE-family HTH domain
MATELPKSQQNAIQNVVSCPTDPGVGSEDGGEEKVTRKRGGPAMEIVEGYADMIRARLTALDMTQTQLAKHVGADKGTISRLINERQAGSSLLADVAATLNLPLPYLPLRDLEDATWIEMGRTLRDLDAARYERIKDTIRDAVELVQKKHDAADVVAQIANKVSDPGVSLRPHDDTRGPPDAGVQRPRKPAPRRRP